MILVVGNNVLEFIDCDAIDTNRDELRILTLLLFLYLKLIFIRPSGLGTSCCKFVTKHKTLVNIWLFFSSAIHVSINKTVDNHVQCIDYTMSLWRKNA